MSKSLEKYKNSIVLKLFSTSKSRRFYEFQLTNEDNLESTIALENLKIMIYQFKLMFKFDACLLLLEDDIKLKIFKIKILK